MAKSELSSLVGRTSTSEHGKQTQSAGPARLAMGLRLASWSSIQNASGSRLLHDSRDNYLDFHRPKDGLQMDRSVLGGLRAHRPLAAPAQQPSSHFCNAREAIVAARKVHPRWGPKKLRAVLLRAHPGIELPSISTFAAVFKRHGLIVPRRRRRRTPPSSNPLSGATHPNIPMLCGASTSRATFEGVERALRTLFQTFGLPDAIRSDNGSPFASKAPAGLSELSAWWLKLGIRHEHIETASHSRMAATSGCISPSNSPPPLLLPAPGKPSSVPSTAFASSTMSSALTKRSTNASLPTSTAARSDFDYPEDYERSRVRNRPPRLERSLRLCLCRSEAAMARPSVANERPWRVYFCQLPIGTLSGNRVTPL